MSKHTDRIADEEHALARLRELIDHSDAARKDERRFGRAAQALDWLLRRARYRVDTAEWVLTFNDQDLHLDDRLPSRAREEIAQRLKQETEA